jgi:hypothetical protein
MTRAFARVIFLRRAFSGAYSDRKTAIHFAEYAHAIGNIPGYNYS